MPSINPTLAAVVAVYRIAFTLPRSWYATKATLEGKFFHKPMECHHYLTLSAIPAGPLGIVPKLASVETHC